MMASDHASKTQGLSSLPTASCHIQEPHPLLVITLAQILAKKRPSFISASSLIGAYFFPVEIQVHPPIFEILRYRLLIPRVIFKVALLNGLIVAVVFFLGDQFKYGDHCRIKHLPTQQYLSVTQRGSRQKV